MTNIPTFSAGERLTAAKLNRLAAALRELQREAAAARITAGNGGTFSRTAGGTTLDVRRAAPPQVPAQQAAADWDHPFKVTLLPPDEADGRLLVQVSIGKVIKTDLYSSVGYLAACFIPVGQSDEVANTADRPERGSNPFLLVLARNARLSLQTSS